MLKKLLTTFIFSFLLIALSSPIFAEENATEVSIKNVIYSSENNSLTVNAYASESIEKVVVMVSEYNQDNLFSAENIVYFNSFSVDKAQGLLTFTLTPAKWFDKANKSYVIRLGAKSCNKADYLLLFPDSKSNGDIDGVYFGDVDNNGVINNADVHLVMEYVYNYDNSLINHDIIKRGDLDLDGILTATDAVGIINKIRRS